MTDARKCADCQTPMQTGWNRTQYGPLPGHVRHRGNGLCENCHRRARTPNPTTRKLTIPPLEIVDQALCAQTDPELFYPELGETGTPAKAICRRCPIQAECLQWALDNNEQYGVWGGLAPRERRALLVQQKAG